MSWYIGTHAECTAYNDKVNEVKSYNGSITATWGIVRPNDSDPEQFAIKSCPGIEPDEESSLKLVEELESEWYPANEIE